MDFETTRPSLLLRLRDPADAEAWREFEGRYRELIARYCAARGLQASDAEDVRQIVLLSLTRSMPGFRYSPERGRFHSYLGRVVENAIRRQLARRGREPLPIDAERLDDLERETDKSMAELWDREWMAHHFRLAMITLRETFEPKSLRVFERLVEGLTVEGAAQEFAMRVDAVQKVKQRVRGRLEILIAEQIRQEDETP